MELIRPDKLTTAVKPQLIWPLLCLLLLLPITAMAVCGTVPTVSFDVSGKYAAAGESVDYSVSITNNDVNSCDFTLSVAGDAVGFTSSLPNGTPQTVAGGATDSSIILRVAVAPATADWTSNSTTLSVDAVDTVAITTVFDNNPLLHNSINLNSTKHGGNWGTSKTGSKYGSFSCQTCHVQVTNNIKRIRISITTPDSSFGDLPANGMPILFQSVVDGSADLGDDSRADKSQSSAICETCHSYDAAGTNGVKYHAYTMPSDPGHYNRRDCITCHPHNAGFKASCASCHGGGTQGTAEANYWPDASSAAAENDQPGRHLAHLDALAQLAYGTSAAALLNDAAADAKQKALCAYCHDTPGADADHSTAGTAEVAMHPVWNVGAASSGSYTTADGNCTNSCHNYKATGAGGGVATYGWLDAGTSKCIMCHNDITVTTAGTTGATHTTHLGLDTDFGVTVSCASCHTGAPDWASNSKPATAHLDGSMLIAGSRVAAGEYPKTATPGAPFASCAGGAAPNACHNNGSFTGLPARAYSWGGTLPNDCASCHTAVPASGSHQAHVATVRTTMGSGTWATNSSQPGYYDFGCGYCHTAVNHLNGNVNVAVSGGSFDSGTNKCSTNLCHQDGQGGTSAYVVTEPTWGTPFTVGACNACHGNFPTTAAHPQHVLEVGFHYNAIYSGLTDFLPVTDADAVPAGLTYSDVDQVRGHGNHALEADGLGTAIVSCNTCHFATVTENSNDLASYADVDPNTRACGECHTLAAADAGQPTKTLQVGVAAIADKSVHVNGTVNVRFIDKKIRSKAQLRDENVYTVTGSAETAWTDTTELTNNWQRVNGYKAVDGSSYDEQPGTLNAMATVYNGGNANYYNGGVKTCMVSCHLWEAGRVDKVPVHWVDNASVGSAPLMCIDCHSRLPK